MIKSRLAVFTFDLGASFIDRHIVDLLPGRTVAIGSYGSDPALAGLFPVSCPLLSLDRWALGLSCRLARRAGVSLEWMRAVTVRRFLQRHEVTVVLGEYLDQFVDFVPILDRLRIPYVVQGHGIDVSASLRKPGMAERYLAYRSARAILTRSEFHRQRLINLGLPASRVHVNFGGVDVPDSPPKRDGTAHRRLLAIGRMVPKKGPIYLLEAFRLAASQNSDISLDYVGSGPLFPAVHQFVDACGLSGRVRLHGVVSEETKERLMSDCGVFVQPSITPPDTGDEEGLPAAIQEAMAHGLAIVGTRHAGIPEAVVDGLTGLLVDEGNVTQLAQAMLNATSSAEAMGRAGYLHATEKHTWQSEKSRLSHWLFDDLTAREGLSG